MPAISIINPQIIEVVSMKIIFGIACVNNILERDNLEETPGKWGKKRLKIFP
jgi:hypothetical protein